VGPAKYSPALNQVRPLPGSTLVLVPGDRLADEHLRDYLVWELRGGRVCVEALDGSVRSEQPPPGIAQVVTFAAPRGRPYAGLGREHALGPYTLYDVADSRGGEPTGVEPTGAEPTAGRGPCPFISDGARADPEPG
jgi:hypothetical protein